MMCSVSFNNAARTGHDWLNVTAGHLRRRIIDLAVFAEHGRPWPCSGTLSRRSWFANCRPHVSSVLLVLSLTLFTPPSNKQAPQTVVSPFSRIARQTA